MRVEYENHRYVIFKEGLYTYKISKSNPNDKPVAITEYFNDNGRLVDCKVYLSTKGLEATEKAFTSRGKNKGQLLRKCPPLNTPAAAAWNAIMFHANSSKVGLCHVFMMDDDNRALYNHIQKYLEDYSVDVSWMDVDANALRNLGVW